MLNSNSLHLRWGVLLILAVLISGTVFAQFGAASSATGQPGGSGSGAISGYVISDILYEVAHDGDPTTLDRVFLNVRAAESAATPTEVTIKLISAGNLWFQCHLVSGSRWSCDTSGGMVKIVDMDELSVVAF